MNTVLTALDKLFYLRFLKVYKSPSDLPFWNWIKINETSDTKYIYIVDDYSKVTETIDSFNAFDKLYEKFFNEFVMNKEYEAYIQAKKRLMLKIADAYSSEDMSQITFAEIAELEFNAKYETEGESKNFNFLIAILEKEIGFKINTKEMTLSEFYTHINLFVENQKQMQNHIMSWQKK